MADQGNMVTSQPSAHGKDFKRTNQASRTFAFFSIRFVQELLGGVYSLWLIIDVGQKQSIVF